VFRACAVDQEARPLNDQQVTTDFRPTRAGCLRTEVEFVVDTSGRPETKTVRTLRATDHGFGQAVIAVIPRLEYSPAQINGRPVRQIVTLYRTTALVVTVLPVGSASDRPPRMPRC
jgi:hypothetical protein